MCVGLTIFIIYLHLNVITYIFYNVCRSKPQDMKKIAMNSENNTPLIPYTYFHRDDFDLKKVCVHIYFATIKDTRYFINFTTYMSRKKKIKKKICITLLSLYYIQI